MISVSDAWKDIHQRFILPETNVEITLQVSTDLSYVSEVNVSNEDPLCSLSRYLVQNSGGPTVPKRTLEPNIWALDGNGMVISGGTNGYVNDGTEYAGAQIVMSQPTVRRVPGITIHWGVTEFEGYATEFYIRATRPGYSSVERHVTGNTSIVSVVDMDIESFDTLTINVISWSLPNRRSRISSVILGQTLVFDKRDILNYEHEQQGHPNTGEIPRNSITFSLSNFNGLWSPNNPTGLTKYMSERLPVEVRYGLDVNGKTEWIKAGTFYLSSWDVSGNGYEVLLSARDAFEFLQDTVSDHPEETLQGLVNGIISRKWAEGFGLTVTMPTSLSAYPVPETVADLTDGTIIQMCANVACARIKYPRYTAGNITLDAAEAMHSDYSDYRITSALSYSYPEITLSKPLKSVVVKYGADQTYTLDVSASGEAQTVENPFITTAEQAAAVAEWVKKAIEHRFMVKGSFRADPRLDVFDVVTVESKDGPIWNVLITYIKYTYSGTFRADYEGRVITTAGVG